MNRRRFMTDFAMGGAGAIVAGPAQARQLNGSATVVRQQVGGIDWYCELRGRGPTVVLIPSGEGDCGSFATVADLLSAEFTVLTFDMPGFSRSSDPANFDRYSIAQAANEVATLVRARRLHPATVYGCSSGGQVALRLASEHPDVVRRAP